MTWIALAAVSLALAVIPAGLFFANLRLFRRAPRGGAPAAGDASPPPRVSVLIPARDEERTIVGCLNSVLAARGCDIEVVVLDDHSTDATADLVRRVADRDARVRLASAPPLPDGWCGKQHACARLAELARHDLLLFLDADVRLAPDAVARAARFLHDSGAALVSGFPRQRTRGLLERVLLPLIHFVLLGFLPLARMRRSAHPAYGAGCGQLFLARRDAYDAAGGHAAIRASMHDGITLPRAFRAAGHRTDLFDATDVASCRMYHGSVATWRGLSKNAVEGMAAPAAIVPWTVLLVGGQVLPAAILLAGLVAPLPRTALLLAAVATAAGYAVRAVAAWRFRQSWIGVMTHPLGVLLLIVIQWCALARHAVGRPAAWRGRQYGSVGPGAGAGNGDGSGTTLLAGAAEAGPRP